MQPRGGCWNKSARMVDFRSYRSRVGNTKSGGAAMQQIAHWLQKLGMSEYAQRFAENGIGFAALRHLTDQDLKDVDVLLGHRRIMLAAIQELGRDAVAQRVTAELTPQD